MRAGWDFTSEGQVGLYFIVKLSEGCFGYFNGEVYIDYK